MVKERSRSWSLAKSRGKGHGRIENKALQSRMVVVMKMQKMKKVGAQRMTHFPPERFDFLTVPRLSPVCERPESFLRSPLLPPEELCL